MIMADLSVLTDEEVVEIVCRDNQEAYAEIIRRFQKKLLRYTTYILGDSHKASDAVQETFISAFINLKSFNQKKKFSSWLYRIAHNQAINQLDKFEREQAWEDNYEGDSGINLEEAVIKKQLIREAHTCLEKMPIIYREPLTLYYLEEKSYEEISDILRLPLGTVGTRINRGKISLKKICQKQIK